MNKNPLFLMFCLVVSMLGVEVFLASDVYAANPGCYKVENAQPVRQTCPTSNAIYDNGSGGNIFGPESGACYIYSQNLYDKELGYGDPYVEVDCDNLNTCPDGQELRYNTNAVSAPTCVGVDEDSTDAFSPPTTSNDGGPRFEIDEDGSKILGYLQDGINLLTALAGLAITASVIIGGIQYSTSGGNPQASAAAKKRIGDAILALLALVFLYTFLQWIVPGGIFG